MSERSEPNVGLTDLLGCWRAGALLCALDYAFFSTEDDGEPVLCLLCSDTFGYACADCEAVELADAPYLLALAEHDGWPGLIRWIAARRGMEPLESVRQKMAEYKQPNNQAQPDRPEGAGSAAARS